MFELKSARYLAADALSGIIREGDTAVDATAGNGHDTLTLARLVGETGHVYAFDIQQDALASTEKRLREAGVAGRVSLIHAGHETMSAHVSGPLRAVCFNLGWLPGGDKKITTKWETTREAIGQALTLLMPLGVCTICVYPGHEAGEQERILLTEMLSHLRPQEYNVLHQVFLNAGPFAPECFVIQRM
jgi:tRNA G37 N-methylase Trm5